MEECDKYKYLGVSLDKDEKVGPAIKDKIIQGKRTIGMGTKWGSLESRQFKRRVEFTYDTIVKRMVLLGGELQPKDTKLT